MKTPGERDRMRTLEELANAVDKLNRVVKLISFRNLAVIAVLALIGLPTYFSYWVLQLENRSVLWDIIGQSKVVTVLGDCPVVRTVGIDGKPVFTTYLTYKTAPDAYIVAVLQNTYKPESGHDVCTQLREDRDKIWKSGSGLTVPK